MKVKMITMPIGKALEMEVNDWLDKNPVRILHVQYSTTAYSSNYEYSVLIWYEETS